MTHVYKIDLFAHKFNIPVCIPYAQYYYVNTWPLVMNPDEIMVLVGLGSAVASANHIPGIDL